MKSSLLLIVLISVVVAVSSRNTIRRIDNVKSMYTGSIVKSVLSNVPRGARLAAYTVKGPISTEQLRAGLADNATVVVENIVGGFDCTGRIYGYYADTLNNCQIFHVCVNLNQLFPELYEEGEYYQFSFFCGAGTVFTQDAMVCAWPRSAIPCEISPKLYYLNKNFFVIPEDVPKLSAVKKPKEGEQVDVAAVKRKQPAAKP